MRTLTYTRECDQCGKKQLSPEQDGQRGPGPGDFYGWFTIYNRGDAHLFDFCSMDCLAKADKLPCEYRVSREN